MARIHLDRIRKKYGWTGSSYQLLIDTILAENTAAISRSVGRISKDNWSNALGKISTRQKRFIIPDVSDAFPKRSVFLIKAAEDGKLISDTLKSRLQIDLRDSLNTFTSKTKEQSFLRRRGAKAGTLNPKLIKEFEAKITNTFKSYTRKDPSLGMPKNIHNIAVTEMRFTTNTMKKEYMDTVKAKNPDIAIKKTWIHNAAMSKENRPGHKRMHRKTIDSEKSFSVMTYKKIKGRWRQQYVIQMDMPHDRSAPSSETIGCNCELEYTAQKKRA